ncbi:MAG: HAD hydrolase-like protein [bacterium]
MIHPDILGTRTLIFDMDGTLIASGETAVAALRGGLKRFHKSLGKSAPEYTDKQLTSGIGAPSDDFYSTLLRPEDREHLDRFRSEILHGETSYMKKHRITFPGVPSTLRELKRRGYKIAVVSNCHTPYLHAVMETQNLDRFFDRMSCVGDAPGATKATLIAEVVSDLGGPAVVIGDRGYDVEAAKANNLPAIGALYGYGSREELMDTATWVEDFRHLLDLLNPLRELAERIAGHVTELRPLDRPLVLSLSAPHPALTRELAGRLLTAFTDRNVPVTHLNLARHRQPVTSRSAVKWIEESFNWSMLNDEILAARHTGKIDSSWEITRGHGKGTLQPCRSRAGSVIVVEGSYLPNSHLKESFDLSVWIHGNSRDAQRAIPAALKAEERSRATASGGSLREADAMAKQAAEREIERWRKFGSHAADVFVESEDPFTTAQVVVDGKHLKRGNLLRWEL